MCKDHCANARQCANCLHGFPSSYCIIGQKYCCSQHGCGNHVINGGLITLPTAFRTRTPAISSILGDRLEVIIEAIIGGICCPDNDSQDYTQAQDREAHPVAADEAFRQVLWSNSSPDVRLVSPNRQAMARIFIES